MRSILFAASLITAAGCSRGAEPAASAQAAVDVPASLTLQAPLGITSCPRMWTCDFIHWYATKTACASSCGGVCEVDFNCNGRCICP
jgi:hypothetical protein